MRFSFRATAAALAVSLLGISPAHSISISLSTSLPAVQSGDTVSIDIVASDFAAGEFVSAFDLGLSFDPTLLQFQAGSWSVGSGLGTVADLDYFDFSDFTSAGDGSLIGFVVSLLDDNTLAGLQQGSSVVLASLEFMALDVGAATVAAIGLACNSAAGAVDPATGFAGLLDIGSCSSAEVGIEPGSGGSVPEPGPLALWCVGLLALGLRRSRLHRAAGRSR